MRVLRLFAFLAVAAMLVIAAAGCGGNGGGGSSDGKSADTWASEVCGALTSWVDGLQASSQSLGRDLRNTKDLKAVKAKFVTFLQDAESRTAQMTAKIEEIGPPDVDDGEKIQRELGDAFEKARGSFARATESAKNLSTKDLQSFSTGVSELSADVQRELGAAGDHFNGIDEKYGDEDLNEAVADQPACKRFTETS